MVLPCGGCPEGGLRRAADHRDFTRLNKYARVPPGMRYFTSLDPPHGHWQVPLNESSKLTTFITPWGGYRFRQNVMGLISARGEHNRRADEVLTGMDNVRN